MSISHENSTGSQEPRVAFQPTIFPLQDDEVRRTVATLAGIDQELEEVIVRANTTPLHASLTTPDSSASTLHEVLPESDLKSTLLLGQVRPELAREPESVQQAYRAGVCLAAIVVHKSLIDHEALDQPMEPVRTDYENIAEELRQQVPWRFVRKQPEDHLQAPSRQFLKLYDMSGFLDNAQTAAYFGYLREEWIAKNLGFISADQRKEGFDDLITLGIRDAFGMFAAAYGETIQPQEDNFLYDPKKHFRPDDPMIKKDTLFSMDHVEWALASDHVQEPFDLSWLGNRQPGCGYEGEKTWSITDDRSGHAETFPALKHIDVSWGNEVQAGVTITHLRTYDTGFVQGTDDRRNVIFEVGFRDSVQDIALSEEDVLIVQGKERAIFALGAPFNASHAEADVERGSIKLLGIHHGGEVIPLISSVSLSPSERMAFLVAAGGGQAQRRANLSQLAGQGLSTVSVLNLNGRSATP